MGCCMNKKRVPLYERLPEIYRIKDAEQDPPYQLKAYLSLFEQAFSEIHKNIEELYHNLFIDTCDDWVVSYIADLMGTSHLKGDPWTLRADVADTIVLRRRKGTLSALERLAFDLTGWGIHCRELRENLIWSQHINHMRPDNGGASPFTDLHRFSIIRGGTANLRDPAALSLLRTPFDSYAWTPDVKPPAWGQVRYNLPNTAVFLWRLSDYRVRCAQPVFVKKKKINGVYCVGFSLHPLGEPVVLFNTWQYEPSENRYKVTEIDETPGPIPAARLNSGSGTGKPEKYVSVDTYDPSNIDLSSLVISDTGLQFHVPESHFSGETWPEPHNTWTIRGANLCAWADGVFPRVKDREIVIDPVRGRVVFGAEKNTEANALKNHLLVTFTYGAPGPVGAHPISRSPLPSPFDRDGVVTIPVNINDGKSGLIDALNDPAVTSGHAPVVILICTSLTYEINIQDILLNSSLCIRAADNQRPVIKLKQPLSFHPENVMAQDPGLQDVYDKVMSELTVRLEGLYITRDDDWTNTLPDTTPLISRLAVHRLEIINCTLDPKGYTNFDGSHTLTRLSIKVDNTYGFDPGGEEIHSFRQIPEIEIQRSVIGACFIDTGYTLCLTDSILDAGNQELFRVPAGTSTINDLDNNTLPETIKTAFADLFIPLQTTASVQGKDPSWQITDRGYHYSIHKVASGLVVSGPGFALTGPGNPGDSWGPGTRVNRITVSGRMRTETLCGEGGIWVDTLEVLDHQQGCIRFSYFSGKKDRLPRNQGCVMGDTAKLFFTNSYFGHPGYGQLRLLSDYSIREHGPGEDMMGAFGFLYESHKWRNLTIRFREFMPVGIRPLFIPVT